MAYIKASTARIRRPWTLRGHLRGLGATSAIVGNTLQIGPSISPVSSHGPARRVTATPIFTPSSPVVPPVGPARRWNGSGGGAQPTPLQNGTSWWQQNGQNNGQGGNGGWGGGGGNGGGGNGGWSSDNPSSSNNLAQLVLQYQANPSSLTEQQWQQLQAAGVIPSTVPYSNASLINSGASSSSAIDPATGQTYASELAAAQAAAAAGTTASSGISTALSTPYAGIPLYVWLGGGALLFILLSKRR